MRASDSPTLLRGSESEQDLVGLRNFDQGDWFELDNLLQYLDDQPKIPEPDDFRENTFNLLYGLSSYPSLRSSTDPTLANHVRTVVEYLANLSFGDVSHSAVAQRKALHRVARSILKAYLGLARMIGCTAFRVAQLSPSPGYEPLLRGNGCNDFAARALPHLVARIGRREASESNRWRPVVEAIRFLAQPGRRRKAMLSRAELVFQAHHDTSVVDTIFSKAHVNPNEFLGLLKSLIDGAEVDYRRIAEIAESLRPALSVPRGPKVTAASAAHEILLETMKKIDKPTAYTWNDTEEKFTDAPTQATRLEFGVSNFDPRAAHRRNKRKDRART